MKRAALAVSLAVALSAAASFACDCLTLEPNSEDAFARASIVVLGTVKKVESASYVVDVQRAFKGAVGKTVTVTSPASSCGYRLARGNKVLLYVPERDGGLEIVQCRKDTRVVWGDVAAAEAAQLGARDGGR